MYGGNQHDFKTASVRPEPVEGCFSSACTGLDELYAGIGYLERIKGLVHNTRLSWVLRQAQHERKKFQAQHEQRKLLAQQARKKQQARHVPGKPLAQQMRKKPEVRHVRRKPA